MRSDNSLPEGVFPDAPALEQMRGQYDELIRSIFDRGQGRENAFALFIGGGAAVGKSTLAWHVASVLGIRTVVGTDVIRQILRCERPGEDIIQAETWAVGRNGEPKRDVYQGLALQAAQIEPCIETMCRYLLGKGMTSIIEGIHILPSALFMRISAAPRCIVCFVDASDTQLRSNYVSRAVSTHMRSQSEGFADVDRRIHLHRQIVDEARKAGFPVLAAETWSELVDATMALLGEKLERP